MPLVNRPYRQEDPRAWMPWHPKKPLKRLPMWQESTHISHSLLCLFKDILKKASPPQNQGNDALKGYLSDF